MSETRQQKLEARLVEALRAGGPLMPGALIMVAVSGGLDSTVLLHLLRFPLRDMGLNLVAAHFDHRMRPGSAADADWIAGLCRAWDVPLERGVSDRGLGSEADARQARYHYLNSAADSLGADFIATAHHADDQAETVLFRILRGTGLRGLAGIPARRDRIVRPLLDFRRGDLQRYADSVGLRHGEDPTNQSLGYARNRLRHEIMPRLESFAPGAAASLVRLAGYARSADDAMSSAVDAVEANVLLEGSGEHEFLLARDRLLAYHPHVRSGLLRRLLARLGSRPDRSGTEAILTFIIKGASGGRVDARGGVIVEREFDRIRISRPGARCGPPTDQSLRIVKADEGRGRVVIGGRGYRVGWSASGRRLAGASEAFDRGEMQFPLEVRGWRAGDRLRLSYGTKKLKKLYAERRIGRSKRDSVPVLADAGGRILWVVGVARAELASPAPADREFRVSVSGDDGE